MRTRAVVLLAFVTMASLAVGCTPVPVRPAPGERQPAESSLESTVGPLGVGEHARIGLYDISMSASMLLRSPRASRDLPVVPARMPPGHLLADIRVEVKNTTTAGASGETTLPAPAFGPFRLVDERGVALDGAGIGCFRSQPVRSPNPGSYSNFEVLSSPIRPGEVYTLNPQFTVPPTARTLTLRYRPFKGKAVVEFRVK